MRFFYFILLFLFTFISNAQVPDEFPDGIETETITASSFINKNFNSSSVVLLGNGTTRGVDTFGQVSQHATFANFPAIGRVDNLYVALDTQLMYVWDGSGYIEVGFKDEKETVIVAEGQSNMVGDDANIVPYDITPNKNVLIWNTLTSTWDVLQPTNDKIYFAFAKKYQETYGGVVKIILNASGGRPISEWTQNYDSDVNYVTDRHQLLIDQLTASGVTKVNIHLWHQGESNSADITYAYKLKERIRLLETLSQYDTGEFSFLFGEICRENPTYKIWLNGIQCFENIIKKNNVALVKSNGLVSVTSGVAVNVHFDGIDLHKFGLRYFEVYQSMSLGQNLQKNNLTYYLDDSVDATQNDSDNWDLTADTFIVDTNFNSTILVLPRNHYRKEYTIVNLKATDITLLPYSGTIKGQANYILKANTIVKLKSYANFSGTVDQAYVISESNTPKPKFQFGGTLNFSLNNETFKNSIIVLTGQHTITVPTGLDSDYECEIILEGASSTVQINAGAGVTISKSDATNTVWTSATDKSYIKILRINNLAESYIAKKL